jgi:hypothetical protein
LNEPARNICVVIFYENYPILETSFPAHLVNLLNQRFPTFILRMSFPGKDELHRMGLIVQESLQTLAVTEQQCAALVSGKPTRKSNRQKLRIENLIHAPNRFRGFAGAFSLNTDTLPDKLNQTLF